MFEVEPLPLSDPLLTLDNVVLSPHWMAVTWEQAEMGRRDIRKAPERITHGLLPDNVLNPAVLSNPSFKSKLSRFGQ